MINRDDYKLSDKNFHNQKTIKNQILLMDTNHAGMVHYDEWLKKTSFGYKKTSHFTIDKNGSIFEHYSPEYYGTIFGLDNIDQNIITISMENEGWLEFSRKKKGFINWCGDIYKDKDSVIIEQWRGQLFWVPYTTSQVDSLIKLIGYLCDEYGIKKRFTDTRSSFEMVENVMGVVLKSNYSRSCTDLNPSIDIKDLKEKIEI